MKYVLLALYGRLSVTNRTSLLLILHHPELFRSVGVPGLDPPLRFCQGAQIWILPRWVGVRIYRRLVHVPPIF